MKKIIFISLSAILIFSACAMEIKSSKKASEDAVNDSEPAVTDSEAQILAGDSGQIFFNPDMGFYSAVKVKIDTRGAITNIDDVYDEINHSVENVSSYSSGYHFNLVNLEVDLSAFSGRVNESEKDIALTKNHLKALEEVLDQLLENEKTTVIRFAYDPDYNNKLVSYTENGKSYKACEPLDFQKILDAVDLICSVLKRHLEVITALQCGMLGPWGEMHTTFYAESPKNGKPRGYLVEVMKQFMKGLKGCDLPLLVRQPQFIYCYLTDSEDYDVSSIPESKTFSYGDDLYRLGIYNDAYLADEGDSGTFVTDNGRQAEIAFLEPYTNHTPYGGELIGTYGLENGIEQLKNVHLSFLNIGWNETYLKKLDSSSFTYNGETIFKYLLKYMGYRYVITSSTFDYFEGGKKIGIKLSFKNEGLANLPYHRKKAVRFYFIPCGSEITGNENYIEGNGNLFTGQEEISFKVDVSSLASGDYDVYAKFCNEESGKFALRFANDGWNEKLRANKIGSLRNSR
ncbi:DUF4832 domain-containing protein [Treponema sp. JC4]|uniref:DUF4832 domain-containing protein n=1 Tax=Treponema sp. JC4 TaxID=1124982 RepID=UPI0002ECC6BF|nr:DUF4832 domain-containing protein [Treponema sp. JC4]